MKQRALIVFIFCSILASTLSYVLYPLLSRLVSESDYVSITLALSLFTQISAFLSSIVAITIGISRSYKNQETGRKLIASLQSFLFYCFIVIGLIFLSISPFILPTLHLSPNYSIPIVLMLLCSIPITIISGYFNGRGQMSKLGFITFMAAFIQFCAAIGAAYWTRSGFTVLCIMATAQFITILSIFTIFHQDRLHKLLVLENPKKLFSTSTIRSLIRYTAIASGAIMTINILQIADLLIIQSQQIEPKFYTDIYIVSRAVFFAGMILIWPFLGTLDLKQRANNLKPFLRLIGYFTILSVAAVAGSALFSEQIFHLLFGSHYAAPAVLPPLILSVIFKYLFLILTAICLYYTVVRSYISPIIVLVACLAFTYYQFSIAPHQKSLNEVLSSITVIAFLLVIFALSTLWVRRHGRMDI